MVEYIYFVKCPNYEDEQFDFFDKAKECALHCLSLKPIITQVEVNRNDFGECTDSADLGTVWSWEDMMSDTEKEPSDKPSLLTKDFLNSVDTENDPEFAALDNAIEVNTEDDDFRAVNAEEDTKKPIPEGMTIEQLVEEMEENEDEVECTWCNELFPKDQCRYEVDMGYLCSRCEGAIKSRGETLTFRENNYFDCLDEEKEPVKEYIDRDPFDHHDPDYSEEEAADALADEIDRAWDSRYDDAIDALDEGWLNKGDRFTIDSGNGVERYMVMSTDNSAETSKNDRCVSVALENEDGEFEDYGDMTFSELSALKRSGKLIVETVEFNPDEVASDKLDSESDFYNNGLVDCPECGANNSLDPETGVCNNCGYIFK